MTDNGADRAPHQSIFERMGDQFSAWMPEWFTDRVALVVITAGLALLMMGL